MSAIEVLGESLEERGLKLTFPRRRVLEEISRHGDSFTAEEVHARVPFVGRATVYRTIKLLVELGLVCKMALQDGTPRYRLRPRVHHHHLICAACGSVQDFARCTVEEVTLRLEQATGYRIAGHRVEMYGVCPGCQAGTP